MRNILHPGILLLLLLASSCGKSARSDGNDGSGGATADGGGGGSGGSSGGGSGGSGTAASSAGGVSTGSGGSLAAGGTGGADEPSILINGEPIYTRVQRLTNSQWDHAVTDILRFEVPANLSRNFQLPVAGITDFTNNELVLQVGETEVLDYEAASEAAAALATASPEALEALYHGTDAEGFIQSFGRRAFRRPLTDEEALKYLDVFELGETLYGEGFDHGAALVIRAMLQSPHFLYRTELGPSGEPLSGYELAAKLSLWLLDTTPSDALLDAAAAGDLDDVEALARTAGDMLETPAALEVMRDFHRQLYKLTRLLDVAKNDVPEYSATMNQELLDVSYAFFDSVFDRNEGLTQILTSTRGYVGPALAPLHGLTLDGDAVEEVDLGPERTGYFMQVPFLMLQSFDLTPGSIQRGTALAFDVLCANIPPPPPGPIPPLPPIDPNATNRERVTAATAGCGSPCHDEYIDPLGFAFEGFDGLGRARDTDNGLPIDSAGSYPFSDGESEFSDARELMHLMATSPEAHLCYSKKVTGYALGRDIAPSDRPLLEELADVSQVGSLKEVIVDLVRQPAFRVRQEAPQ